MRILIKTLKYLAFLCLMAAGVAGTLYVERETDWVERFQTAIGLNGEEERPRGISFAGNGFGNQGRKKNADSDFSGAMGLMMTLGAPVMAQQQAVLGDRMQAVADAIEMNEAMIPPEAPPESKKTYKSGGLSNSYPGR